MDYRPGDVVPASEHNAALKEIERLKAEKAALQKENTSLSLMGPAYLRLKRE